MEDRFIDNHFIWLLANWLWPAYVINSNCSVNNGTTVYFQSSSSIDFVPCRLSSSIDDNKIISWIVSFLASDAGADNMECMHQRICFGVYWKLPIHRCFNKINLLNIPILPMAFLTFAHFNRCIDPARPLNTKSGN